MSWMQRLYETYENASRTTAIADPQNPLPELGFITGEMPITVYLSPEGNFLDVDRSPKGERILVPCTLASGVARQYPVSPHPIFEAVKYLGEPEQMTILRGWCEESDVPESVHIVYKYLNKKMLKHDIEQVFSLKNMKFSDNDGVKFNVINTSLTEPNELWKSSEVRSSWKSYFENTCLQNEDKELCYVLGKKLLCTKKHPYAVSNTYIISMKDENCEGRFLKSASNALSISSEVSFKTHNSLKWLINRQGRRLYDTNTVFLSWDTGGRELPDILNYDPADKWAEYEDETQDTDTWTQLGKALSDASCGYESKYLNDLKEKSKKDLSNVVVIILDSATGKGRISIVYYQEMDISDYLRNLLYWYNSCRWEILRKVMDNNTEFLRTPLPNEICNLIYGARGDKSIKKLKKQLIKRLIPCITARRPLPPDIVRAAFYKVINTASFQKNNKWDKNGWSQAVGITCALIRKFYEKEEHPLALIESNNERNYLYGRLLAVADVAEYDAMSNGDKKWRQTNAIRYMQRFQQRPYETWLKLYTTYLPPYLNRLREKSVRYTKIIDQITNLFQPGEMAKTERLDVKFLEGYSCQKYALFAHNSKSKNEEDDNNGNS